MTTATTTAPAMTPAQALRFAAERIERDGRAIGCLHDADGRACVIAAIHDAAAVPNVRVALDALDALRGRIRSYTIMGWADDRELPDRDVAAALRATADGLDGTS